MSKDFHGIYPMMYTFFDTDEAQVEKAERLHAALLPLLTFIMASPEHMLCYGKRMFARRIGLHEVHPRQPCVMPSEFGLDIIGRYARDLPSLAAGRA